MQFFPGGSSAFAAAGLSPYSLGHPQPHHNTVSNSSSPYLHNLALDMAVGVRPLTGAGAAPAPAATDPASTAATAAAAGACNGLPERNDSLMRDLSLALAQFDACDEGGDANSVGLAPDGGCNGPRGRSGSECRPKQKQRQQHGPAAEAFSSRAPLLVPLTGAGGAVREGGREADEYGLCRRKLV